MKCLNCTIWLLVTFLSVTLNSQTLYFEDFESSALNSLPPSMTSIDVDGNTPDSSVSSFTDAWQVIQDFSDPSDQVAASNSWYIPFGQSDDWMITPLISGISTITFLSWDAKAQDPNYPDSYEVYISSTGNTTADFLATTPIFTINPESSIWVSHSIDIGAYAGQNIYIAFRNVSNNQFIILIDDILVESFCNASIGTWE